eukprot:symbB.v1.2.028014.t1/scaffold2922.1/size67172/4
MEAHRRVVQLYHEDDTCCYAAANRHRELRHHEEDIRRELRSYTDHGWFTAVVGKISFLLHRRHELSQKDKKLIAWVLEHPNLPPESPHWNILPCDVLHGESNDAALCFFHLDLPLPPSQIGERSVQLNFVADSEYAMCWGGLGGACVPQSASMEIFMDGEEERLH